MLISIALRRKLCRNQFLESTQTLPEGAAATHGIESGRIIHIPRKRWDNCMSRKTSHEQTKCHAERLILLGAQRQLQYLLALE